MTHNNRSSAHTDEHCSAVPEVDAGLVDTTHAAPSAAITGIEPLPSSAPLWCPQATQSVRAQLAHFVQVGVMAAEEIAHYSHCWHSPTQDGTSRLRAEGERVCRKCGTLALCPWCSPAPTREQAAPFLLVMCPACQALTRECERLEERLRSVVASLTHRCALRFSSVKEPAQEVQA